MDPLRDLSFLISLKQIASLVLFGGFVVMIAGEILLPAPGYRWSLARCAHAAHNLLLWLVGIAVMSIVFGGMVWFMLQWLQFRGIGILYFLRLPIWLHAILAFALIDACDYAFHRLSHNVRWLWLLHAVHHSDRYVDVTTNLRQHPLHLVATQAWKLVACAAIGVALVVVGFGMMRLNPKVAYDPPVARFGDAGRYFH